MASNINQSVPVANTPALAGQIQSNFAIAAQEITDLQNALVGGGPQGAQGAQGSAGTQGFQGAAGSQGAQGHQGGAGVQGAQGATGAGTQGAQGHQGSPGPSGAGGPAVAHYGPTPPPAPVQGQLWMNENPWGMNVWDGFGWNPIN